MTQDLDEVDERWRPAWNPPPQEAERSGRYRMVRRARFWIHKVQDTRPMEVWILGIRPNHYLEPFAMLYSPWQLSSRSVMEN